MRIEGVPSLAVLAAGLSPESQGVGQALVNSTERQESAREVAAMDRDIRRDADEHAVAARKEAAQQAFLAAVASGTGQIAAAGGKLASNASGGGQQEQWGQAGKGSHDILAGWYQQSAELARSEMEQQQHLSRDAGERIGQAREAIQSAVEDARTAIQSAKEIARLQNATTDAALGSRV